MEKGAAAICFNPCCVGFYFWTYGGVLDKISVTRFQSLLCWIFLLDFQSPKHLCYRQIVSILVVLDFSFGL